MAIDIDHADLERPTPIEDLSTLTTLVSVGESKESEEPEEPDVQCIGCCTELPKAKAPRYAHEVIKPCRFCNSTYCVQCVRSMFLKAFKDSTRMPPRCCVQIHLHHIKPHLTAEEILEYKSKYEEWSTPKPFYCPRPTCSVFIPERLLPRQAESKGKRKADSGIGIPTPPMFMCPKCEGEICINCRQAAHTETLCASLDLGVDAETAALLKEWGYKRCPKCSQGLKRMYGCNHMECRCGAHFCWACLRNKDDCEEGCYEGGDGDEDNGSDFEPDEPEPLLAQDNHPDTTTTIERMVTEEQVESVAQAHAESASETTRTLQTTSRPRNLDGGSAHYWENQDLHFGDEPNDDIQDRVWDCYHTFKPYTVALASSISRQPSAHELECVKCWCAIRPAIETPQKSTNVPTKTVRIPGNGVITGRARGGYVLRDHRRSMVARLRPAAYLPPRGLFRSDATIGTARHLTATLTPTDRGSTNLTTRPMEDVRSDADLDAAMTDGEIASDPATQLKKTAIVAATSNVFNETTTADSVAQECENCSLLVCQECADDILEQRRAEQEASEAERVAAEADESDAEVGAQQSIEVSVPTAQDEGSLE
ncbi:hypothetical protein EJ07DRAFT_114429 [Lizonia empirigonia]|nr:hypothetical protein EJ07DRAFT_114429 [Lizonia empirigonia]